jgi:hypothetical protein
MIPLITGAAGTISKIIQKIPDQHTGKAQKQGTTHNSHIRHCTHTASSTDVKVKNVYHQK